MEKFLLKYFKAVLNGFDLIHRDMLIKMSFKIFSLYNALYIHRYILSVLKHCSGTPCYYDMVSPLCPKSA